MDAVDGLGVGVAWRVRRGMDVVGRSVAMLFCSVIVSRGVPTQTVSLAAPSPSTPTEASPSATIWLSDPRPPPATLFS